MPNRTMTVCATGLYTIALAAACTTPAAAQMTLLNDDRSVFASGFANDAQGTDSDTDSATPTSPFASFNATAAADGLTTFGYGNASAMQSTLVETTFIGGQLDAQSSALALSSGSANATGDAISVLEVTFSIDEGTPFTINGTLAAGGDSQAWVRLYEGTGTSGPTRIDHTIVGTGGFVFDPIFDFFVLSAGTYTFQMQAESHTSFTGTNGSTGGSAGIDVSLNIVPAPAGTSALLLPGVLASRRRR